MQLQYKEGDPQYARPLGYSDWYLVDKADERSLGSPFTPLTHRIVLNYRKDKNTAPIIQQVIINDNISQQYEIDEQGRKNGLFASFGHDGSLVTLCETKNDKDIGIVSTVFFGTQEVFFKIDQETGSRKHLFFEDGFEVKKADDATLELVEQFRQNILEPYRKRLHQMASLEMNA